MNDDALAPVVGMMLILAIVVTLFSLWNVVYLPGLKQQAEVEHLQQVEEGMTRIDAAIEDAMYYRHNGSLSVPIPLGGGDIMLNNLRSGGELRIEKIPATTIKLDGADFDLFLSNITYTPVSNFWIPQGYSWQYGYVNVTKGALKSTELMLKSQVQEKKFAEYLFNSENDGDVIITCVNIMPGTRNVTSGNGIATLNLDVTKTSLPPVSDIEVTLNGNLPPEFRNFLYDAINTSLNASYESYSPPLNYRYNPPVTIERIDIVLSVE